MSNLKVGQSASFSKTISEYDIYGFAGISGDMNPFHVDEIFVKDTFFKHRIAHGVLLLSFVSTVLGMKLPGLGTILASLDVKFLHPAYLGDTITASVEILGGPPAGSRVTNIRENPDFPLETGEVYIGKHTHIAPNVILSGIGGIYIGKNSGVAANSAIYSFSHHYKNLVDREDAAQYSFTPLARLDQQAMILGPVVLEDFTAVGLNSVILPGVSLKRGSWVASGTVVSGSCDEQTLLFNHQTTQKKSLAHLTIKE